jgi:hypothetical protein
MQMPTAQLFDKPISASVSVKGKHEITLTGEIMPLIRYASYCTVGIYHPGVAGKPASYDDIIRELGKSESVTFQGVNADYQVTFTR